MKQLSKSDEKKSIYINYDPILAKSKYKFVIRARKRAWCAHVHEYELRKKKLRAIKKA